MTSQHDYQPLHPEKACELVHQDLGPVVSVLGSSKSESSLMEMVKAKVVGAVAGHRWNQIFMPESERLDDEADIEDYRRIMDSPRMENCSAHSSDEEVEQTKKPSLTSKVDSGRNKISEYLRKTNTIMRNRNQMSQVRLRKSTVSKSRDENLKAYEVMRNKRLYSQQDKPISKAGFLDFQEKLTTLTRKSKTRTSSLQRSKPPAPRKQRPQQFQMKLEKVTPKGA
jgi:hypothetical protein